MDGQKEGRAETVVTTAAEETRAAGDEEAARSYAEGAAQQVAEIAKRLRIPAAFITEAETTYSSSRAAAID